MAYIKNGTACEYCGKDAKAPTDLKWSDGLAVKPISNKTIGIMCAECCYYDFDDFCRSQGCSAAHPVLHIP